MPGRCSCGAILPEDARFCHRCGAPQFEADRAFAAEAERVATLPTPTSGTNPTSAAPAVDASRITFRNSQAVIITLLVAAGAMVGAPLVSLYAAPMFPFYLCAVGAAAATSYRSRSAAPLSTGAAARLGWMTGLWLFLVMAVLLTVVSLFVASAEGWRQIQANWERVPQTARLLRLNQHEFLIQMLWTLPFSFFMLTLLPGLGGILGVKLFARRPR